MRLEARGRSAYLSAMRPLWILLGLMFTGIGVVGLVAPLLPGVVFLLLAAFCFARGSDRLHDWLLAHPRLGPPILAWREHGAIPRRAKLLAVAAMALSFGLTAALGVALWALAAQAAALTGAAAFVLTRPDGPAP